MSTRHCLVPTLGSQLLSCSILVQLLTNWLELINFRLKKKRNGKKKTITILSRISRKGKFSSTWKMWWSPLTRTPAHPYPVSKPNTSIPPPIGPTSLSWGKKGWIKVGFRRYGSFKHYSENNGPCFQQSEKGFNYHYFNFQNSDYILCMDNI